MTIVSSFSVQVSAFWPSLATGGWLDLNDHDLSRTSSLCIVADAGFWVRVVLF